MEPYADEFSTNNNLPSGEQNIKKAKELLVKSRKELDETRSEIQRLESLLTGLKEKEDDIQNSIKEYTTLLSPARRIPPDILREIFHRCLPNFRNPIMSASEAPVLLTRICSSWRSLALSSPLLWARIHIPYSDEYRVDESMDFGPTNATRVLRTLQLRCNVIKDWLTRSGGCALSISINYASRVWAGPDGLDWSEEDLTIKLFRSILPLSNRWHDLEFIGPLIVYQKFESMVPIQISTLTRLKVHLLQNNFEMLNTRLALLTCAPNLKRLSLSGAEGFWMANNGGLAWSCLTYLCIHSGFNVAEAFSLLKICGKLVHCKLIIMDFSPDPPNLSGVASLPHLRSLSIFEGFDSEMATKLYDQIDAPQLRWLDYQKPIPNRLNLELTGSAIPSPLFSLLHKSSEIAKLTFDPRTVARRHMSTVLRLANGLTHLVLGKEPQGPTRKIPRFEAGAECTIDLESLVIDPSAGSVKENFLPNLEVFEAYARTSTSDEALLRFITSRMNPSSPSGIAVLKQVRVAFDRPHTIDIVGKVSRLATQAGISIKLDLDYLPFALPTQNTLSPSYGLTLDDGPTWPHPDIEEAAVPVDERQARVDIL